MKSYIRILKFVLKIILIIIIIIFTLLLFDFRNTEFINIKSSFLNINSRYIPTNNPIYRDSLLKNFGNNKLLPKGYENQTLIALSHFPELNNINIEFIFLNLDNSALMSRPTFSTIFLPWSEKRYLVFISNYTEDSLLKVCLLKNLPYNAQIGVIAHELSHITSYYQKKSYQLITEFFSYEFSKEYFNKIENKTDLNVIRHGLGYQLLSWSEFQHNIKVKMGLGDAYLSPNIIKLKINDDSIYSKKNSGEEGSN